MPEDLVLEVDDNRSLTVSRSEDGATLTLAVEDPHSVSIVELTMREVDWLTAALLIEGGPIV